MAPVRIKKTLIFNSISRTVSKFPVTLFFHCEPPVNIEGLQKKQSTLDIKIGSICCVCEKAVYECEVKTLSNLNPSQTYNEDFFRRLFKGMEQFSLKEGEQNNQDDCIEIDPQTQNSEDFDRPKILQVRDLEFLSEERFLMRCTLKHEKQFTQKPIDKLWSQFSQYSIQRKGKENQMRNLIKKLKCESAEKVEELKEKQNQSEIQKKEIQAQLSLLFREKKQKLQQFDDSISQKISNFGRQDEEESSNMSFMQSDFDFGNSQMEKPLIGSIFDSSQAFKSSEGQQEAESLNIHPQQSPLF